MAVDTPWTHTKHVLDVCIVYCPTQPVLQENISIVYLQLYYLCTTLLQQEWCMQVFGIVHPGVYSAHQTYTLDLMQQELTQVEFMELFEIPIWPVPVTISPILNCEGWVSHLVLTFRVVSRRSIVTSMQMSDREHLGPDYQDFQAHWVCTQAQLWYTATPLL